MELNVMVGVPGSGKSYYIKNHCSLPRDVVVSRDAIRFSLLQEGESYFSHENKVFRLFCDQINKSAFYKDLPWLTHLEGEGIVWADATHLNARSRAKLLYNIDLRNFSHINFICINASLETCLRQNSYREGLARVPESSIVQMFNAYECPSAEELDWIPNIGYIQIVGGDYE